MRNDHPADPGKMIVIWRWLSRSDDAANRRGEWNA